jgi:Thioredoxin domain-containing protein
MKELDKENFDAEVIQSGHPMVLDFWGPQCGPCLALMPEVEKLAAKYDGRVTFCKVNVSGNRRLCIALKVMSVPTILFYKKGECVSRLTGEEVSIGAITAGAEALL